MSSEDKRTIRRYLLQELGEEERQRVEEKMMTDDAFFEEITFAEDELAAEYAGGALGRAEHQKFEQSYLTTAQGRDDVNFNKAFRAHLPKMSRAAAAEPSDQPGFSPNPILWFWRSQRAGAALALGVVLILVAGSARLVVTEGRRKSEIEQLQTQLQQLEKQLEDERNQSSQMQADLQALRERKAYLEGRERTVSNARESRDPTDGSGPIATGILSVPLFPPTRAPGGSLVTIPPDKHVVRLTLRGVSPDYVKYTAELKPSGGQSPVVETRRVRSETQVILKLPADSLAPGNYEIRVLGVTSQGNIEIGSYYFTVVK